MKKQSGFRRLVALALTLCMLAALTAEIFAADIVASGYCGGEGDGTNLTWTLDSEGVLTISGTGKMKDYTSKNAPWQENGTDIKSIVFSSGTTYIGNYAFYRCTSDSFTISFPDTLESIGKYAFYKTALSGELVFPQQLKSIGTSAYEMCNNITGVRFRGNQMSLIGDGAFANCSGLKQLQISNGLLQIGKSAFAGCKNLTGDLIIPDSVTTIGSGAFQNCTGLNGTLTLGTGLKYIESSAFFGCHFTGELIIPQNITGIGSHAFACCKFSGVLSIPDSVTRIGSFAFFECDALSEVYIPEGVSSVSEGAFRGCTLLRKVYLPKELRKIGNSAFLQCSNLEEIVVPDSVTSIGKKAFYECKNLKKAVIGNSVQKILDETFYKCTSLESVEIGDGVTSIGKNAFWACGKLKNVIIGKSVASFDEYAFGGCSFLQEIILPQSVTKIGDCAFNCVLYAYFEGDAPSEITNAKVLRSSFLYNSITNQYATIYYKTNTSGWTDSSAYDAAAGTWNGYPLKTWDGKTIPEETKVSVPTGKYCIRAIDESGNPVSDATVWWNGSRAVTDENGDAFVDLTTVGEPVIRVVKSGYIEWTNKNSNWKKSDTRFEQVILYPKSYGKLKLKYAKISDKFDTNLVIQTKVLNLRNDGALIGDLNSGYFDLSCAATDTSDVTGYAVYQNKKEIAKSTDGNFQKLDVRDFVEGGGCFVRVTGANGQTMDTRINLQFAKNSVNEDFKFELKGNRISFDVSDDVPYIGGTTVSFGLPLEVPVVASATTDKMQFGINLKLNPDKSKEEQIDSYIKNIKKLVTVKGVKRSKANAKALKNCAAQHNKAEFFKDYDITVCGYAEADFGSNTASGYILFIVDRQLVDYEYNTVIVIPISAVPLVFPITVQVGAELSLEAGAAVSYKFDSRTWNGNVVLNPSVGLTPFVGIGYSKVTGVGAYGDADLNAKINLLGKNSGCQTVDLTGEFGVKGYFGPWEWHKAFANQTWHIYAANTVKSNSLSPGTAAWDADLTATDFTPSDLSYLAAESDWMPASAQTYAAGRAAQLKVSYQTLLQNTYRNAQPVMISDGSALYAAFVRADADTGVRYVALTKFDGNSWSEPVRVDAGAILDDAPQLCTDGQTLWLAYARTTQDSGDSLVSYAQNQTIVVGTINKNTLAFTEQKTYQSDDYMRLPTLSCVNGTPVLAWVESAVTDEESVVNPAASTAYTAEYRGGAWLVAHKAADAAGVDSICIGAQNGAAAIAYTADGKLYCGSRLLAENVTGRAIYGRLPGTTADAFIWNADSALHDEAGNTVPVEGLGRDFVIVGDSIYFNQTNGANANLAALHYDAANDHWSAPILLIGDEQYLENLNAAMLNGKTYALGMHTTVTITADDVDDTKDLVWTQILPVSDLQLSDVSFDSDALVPGETLPVTLTVTNSGEHTVSSLTLTADGVSTAQDCQLLPGESGEFTVNITCPSEKQTVTFEVQEPGQDDYTPEDNTADCTVGSADAEIELSLIQIGSRKLVQAAVINHGLETASGSVLFTGPDGQVLAERTFQNLTYDGTVIAEYEPDSFADLYGEDVTATVILQQDEPNTPNNTDSVPVLLTATEILSAQRDGNTVAAEIACMQDGARVICAFYDANGRLLRTAIQTLQSGKTNSLSFTISDSNAAYAKLFVLDAKNAPAAAGKTVSLNG